MHRREHRRCLALVLLLFSAGPMGCAESTRIRTTPAGARVFVNGEFIGTSPATYQVKKSQWPGRFPYRIEMAGYQSSEGELATRPSAGRIIGTIFTLGILAIFKRPVTLIDPQDFVLSPAASAPAPAPLPNSGERTIEDRLRDLQEARDTGLITEQDFQRRRQEILDGL